MNEASKGLVWRKANLACNGGECVELAELDDGGKALRSSLQPEAVAIMTGPEWTDFVRAVREGVVI